MKPLAIIAFLLSCFTLLAADINITNVTKSATVPAGSFALGQTGLVTRLLPLDLFPQLSASQTFTGSNNFSGGLAVNGVPVVTNASGGSQVWTNGGSATYPANVTNVVLIGTNALPSESIGNLIIVQSPDVTNVAGTAYNMESFLYAGNFHGAEHAAGWFETRAANTNVSGLLSGNMQSGALVAFDNSRLIDNGYGESAAIHAWGNSSAAFNYGIVSIASDFIAGQANIGIAANVQSYGSGTSVGAYIQVENYGTSPVFEPSVLLLDSTDQTVPLIVGRKDNGTTVFKVEKTGTVKVTGTTNSIILPCPNGGSFILTVKNDGTLNVITNTGGL